MQMVAANPSGEAKVFIRKIYNSDIQKMVLKLKPWLSKACYL